MQFEVWAPEAQTVEVELGSGHVPLGGTRCVWDGGRRRSTRIPTAPTTAFRDRRGPAAARPVVAPPAPGRPRRQPHLRRPLRVARRLVEGRGPRHRHLRVAPGHLHPPPAPSTPRDRPRSTHLVALGVDVVELLPVAAFDGGRLGIRRGRRCTPSHEPYGGPEALPAFVDAAPPPWDWPSAWTSSTTISGPQELPRRSSARTYRAAPNAVGPGDDRPGRADAGRRPGPALDPATTRCAGCATSTSTRSAWTPSTSWSTPPPASASPSSPAEVADLSRRLGRPLVAGGRERPERPGDDRGDHRGWRPRDERPVGRRRPPRPARGADRRAAGLLRRLRVARRDRPHPDQHAPAGTR